MTYTRNCEIKLGVLMPKGMHRIAVGVEYAGADFSGFQKQASTENTIQAHLERAFSDIAQEEISLVCAGRTDAGVHASGQVVHFDTLAQRPNKAWVLGVNTQLPETIRVHWAVDVGPDFHARFSAGSRQYRYVFHCGHTRSAVLGKQVTHCRYSLDFDRMAVASRYLLGEHDFTSFRSSQCQAASPVRHVDKIRWFQQGVLWVMEIRANAFLHHMVRNIVGALIDVGRGRHPPEWVSEVLLARDRRCAGMTAAPWGLYLVHVAYPATFALPCATLGPDFLAE